MYRKRNRREREQRRGEREGRYNRNHTSEDVLLKHVRKYLLPSSSKEPPPSTEATGSEAAAAVTPTMEVEPDDNKKSTFTSYSHNEFFAELEEGLFTDWFETVDEKDMVSMLSILVNHAGMNLEDAILTNLGYPEDLEIYYGSDSGVKGFECTFRNDATLEFVYHRTYEEKSLGEVALTTESGTGNPLPPKKNHIATLEIEIEIDEDKIPDVSYHKVLDYFPKLRHFQINPLQSKYFDYPIQSDSENPNNAQEDEDDDDDDEVDDDDEAMSTKND